MFQLRTDKAVAANKLVHPDFRELIRIVQKYFIIIKSYDKNVSAMKWGIS